MKIGFLALIFCFLGLGVYADTTIERNIHVELNDATAENPRKILMDKAVETLTFDLLRELVDEETLHKKDKNIRERILPASLKYLPYSRPGELKNIGGVYQMDIVFKASTVDLRQLAVKHGIIDAAQAKTYQSEKWRIVLPAPWNIKFVEILKDSIRGQIPKVISISERLLSAEGVVLMATTSLSQKELAERLAAIQVAGRRLAVSMTENEIIVR
jgi:hypothetical protein